MWSRSSKLPPLLAWPKIFIFGQDFRPAMQGKLGAKPCAIREQAAKAECAKARSMTEQWSQVPYPAWWHQRAAKRRAELAAAVNELRLRAGSIPYLIGFLIFGSYARARVGPESDLDLIAVTTDPNPLRGDRYLEIVRRLNINVPYDLVVYDVAEYEQLSQTWPFVQQARAEGIWIDATSPR